MFNFSMWDIILILILSLIIFGPGKMPEVARSLGKGLVEFRKMTNKVTETIKEETSDIKKDLQQSVEIGETKTAEEVKTTEKANNSK